MKLSDAVRATRTWAEIHRRLVPHNQQGDPTAGLVFEEFCRAYFLAEPSEQREFQKVWHHSRLPPRLRKKLTINRRDHGVDLVLQHRDGRYFAVQCKFKTDEGSTLSWTKDRLTSWLSEADECDGLILFTNASAVDDHTVRKCRKKDFRLYTVADLIRLDAAAIQAILRVAKGQKPKPLPRAKPRAYQATAIRDVVRGFKEYDRGQLILPCGAGKTLTALWAMEKLRAKRTLVLVPSLALLRQTKREWSTHQKRWLPYLCVCSEKGIDRDVREDRITAHTYEIHGNVTTDPKEIRSFLRKNKELVVYSTYQSLPQIIRAVRGTKLSFDLVLCDEAHKTAGNRQGDFALVHDGKKVPAKRRLYMTATPKVTSRKVKNRLGEETFKLLADMSDPAVFGPVFHQMTFGTAIAQKILVDYEIIVIGVSDGELRKAIARRAFTKDTTIDEIANNLALTKVMKKYGAGHAITFHSSIRRANDFHDRHRELNNRVWVEHVNGKMSTNDRETLLHEFREQPKAVLTNARCLTEGIDVPAIDCVYFCDPKSSKIDIVQASGRALRQARAKKKRRGYIVVPVFHRNRKNVDAAIDKSVFRHVVDVVRALADQDERIQAEIHALVANRGRRRAAKTRITIDSGRERIHLVGFERALKRALFDQIVEKSTTSWDARILALLEYKKQFGTMRVPKDARPPWHGLGRWVDNIRQKRRLKASSINYLGDARIRELEALGFEWRLDGETLSNTYGLLHETQFREVSGFSNIARYRKRGLIKPVGFALTPSAGVMPWYHPRQIEELKRKLGITLDSTDGLLNETEFIKASGLTGILRYRRRGLIKPAGFALSGRFVGPFYRPEQAKALRKTLGITLDTTEGLLSEKEFMKASGLSMVASYREKGIITPVGYAMSASKVGAFYHRSQIQELRRKLGINLNDVDGLLTESQFARAVGISSVGPYRRRGLVSPVGRGLTGRKIAAFYHPRQVALLRQKLGITLASTKGLLEEQEFAARAGVSGTTVINHRLRGLIVPVGFAPNGKRVGAFYSPNQISELRKRVAKRKPHRNR